VGRQRYLGAKAQGLIQFGSNTLVDGETITVGNKVFEWDNNAAVTAGRVLVTIGGSAALSAAALLAAINANKPTPGVTAVLDTKSNVTVRLYADARGVAGNMTVSETITAADITVESLVSGEAGGTQTEARGAYTVTDEDVVADNIEIDTGLTSPRFVQVEIRSAAGVPIAHTAEVTVTSGRIRLNFAGAVDPAAGHVVSWSCWE
jgi:hypothetical protein